MRQAGPRAEAPRPRAGPRRRGAGTVRRDWQALHDAGLPFPLDHRGGTNAPHVTIVSAPSLPPVAVESARTTLGGVLPLRLRASGLLLLGGDKVTVARALDVDDAVAGLVLAGSELVPAVSTSAGCPTSRWPAGCRAPTCSALWRCSVTPTPCSSSASQVAGTRTEGGWTASDRQDFLAAFLVACPPGFSRTRTLWPARPLHLEQLHRGHRVGELGVAPVAGVEVRRLLGDVANFHAAEVGPAVVVGGRVDALARRLDELGVTAEKARSPCGPGRVGAGSPSAGSFGLSGRRSTSRYTNLSHATRAASASSALRTHRR